MASGVSELASAFLDRKTRVERLYNVDFTADPDLTTVARAHRLHLARRKDRVHDDRELADCARRTSSLLGISPRRARLVFEQIFRDITYSSAIRDRISLLEPSSTVVSDASCHRAAVPLLERYLATRRRALLNDEEWCRATKWVCDELERPRCDIGKIQGAVLAHANRRAREWSESDWHPIAAQLESPDAIRRHWETVTIPERLSQSPMMNEAGINDLLLHGCRTDIDLRRWCHDHDQRQGPHRCILLMGVWRRMRHLVLSVVPSSILAGSCPPDEIGAAIDDLRLLAASIRTHAPTLNRITRRNIVIQVVRGTLQ